VTDREQMEASVTAAQDAADAADERNLSSVTQACLTISTARVSMYKLADPEAKAEGLRAIMAVYDKFKAKVMAAINTPEDVRAFDPAGVVYGLTGLGPPPENRPATAVSG